MKQLSVSVVPLVVVLTLLLVIQSGENSAVHGHEQFLNEEYFAWLPGDLVVGGLKSYNEIYRAISELDIEKSDDTQTIYDQIAKAKGQTNARTSREVYSSLMQLANNDDACKPEMVSDYLHVYALMMHKRDDGSLEKLVGYMTELGRAKFGRCARRVEHEFDPARVSSFEAQLDEFYLAGLGQSDTTYATDHNRYGLVRGFNLAKDKFNSQRAFEVARKYTRGTSPMKVLMTFFKLRCANLRRELWLDLNILNIANSLRSHQLESDKLMKLNEYNRICQTWSSLELDGAVRENIQRQL